jgi:hypothetical protein
MPTRRASLCVILASIALASMPAMRQAITTDELDLRTISHATRIAQLELEVANLRADLTDFRDNGSKKSPSPTTSPATPNSPASIPAHNRGAYYFRLTAIVKDASLLNQAMALEKTAAEYREQASKRQGMYGKKLNDAEVRRLLKDAFDFERDAKKLRNEYDNPGFALAGFDADGRDVTCNVTGPAMLAASRIPHSSIVRARGEVIENTDDNLTLNNARVGRVRSQD